MLTVSRTPFRAKLEAISILMLLLSVGSILVLVVAFYSPFLLSLLYLLLFWSSPLIMIVLAVYILDLREKVRSLNERVETLEDQGKESGS